MNELVYIQTIFVPTRKMLDYQVASLKSLAAYLEKYPYNMDIIFTGYIHDDYYEELTSLIKLLFYKKCQFIRYGRNFGKAYIINDTLKDYLKDNKHTKYIFTLDADICLNINQPNIFNRLISTYNSLDGQFGLLACNLTGDNAHWIDKFENKIYQNNEYIVFPTQPVGIAGGCIFVERYTWEKIGGYRVLGIYMPDDALLMQDVFNSGKKIGVVETLSVYHPGTHDDQHYQKWKERTSRQIMGYSSETDRYHDTFWEEKRSQEKYHIKDTTLLIVDCLDINRAKRAIDNSTQKFSFDKIKLLTSIENNLPYSIKIDKISSKSEYSKFCIKDLNRYIDTEFVLLIQYDGFIIGDHKSWTDEFFSYDYIGSPWWYSDGMNIGNGGFSLRSKKLLDILANDPNIIETHPEDHHIGRTYRKYLESKGIKFPSETLAAKFSIEASEKMGYKYNNQFGFHGFDIINYNKIKIL